MSLFLNLNFQGPGPYQDPTQVSWKVHKKDTSEILQEGLLIHFKKANYGTFDQLQRLPPVTEKDIQSPKICNMECKTPEHIRQIVWQVICMWKKTDPELIIGVSGGWSIWSHFLHRLIHDDFLRRSNEPLTNVIDMDSLRLLGMEGFTWLKEIQ